MSMKIIYCCKDCGYIIHKSTAIYGEGRCRVCRNIYNHLVGIFNTKKDNNGRFKGGKPKCIDCGKELSTRKCKRCHKCNGKTRIGINHPRFKDLIGCIDCGTKNKYRYAKRCWKCFIKFAIGKNSGAFGHKPYHSKYIKYNNIYFHSWWEANFAKWLDLSEIKWEYEPKAFELGSTSYRPDFYLPEFNFWIEIKGYWRDDAKEKVNKFIKLNPKINFKIFEKKELQELGII